MLRLVLLLIQIQKDPRFEMSFFGRRAHGMIPFVTLPIDRSTFP